jgi:hypothetical protein
MRTSAAPMHFGASPFAGQSHRGSQIPRPPCRDQENASVGETLNILSEAEHRRRAFKGVGASGLRSFWATGYGSRYCPFAGLAKTRDKPLDKAPNIPHRASVVKRKNGRICQTVKIYQLGGRHKNRFPQRRSFA